MEKIEIKKGDYYCLYCGKNIANMNNECDCSEAINRREILATIPRYHYDIEFIEGKHYIVKKDE